MEPTRQCVRPGVDHAVHPDGNRRLACLEAGRIKRRGIAAFRVRRPAAVEYRLVLDLLWLAPARLGIRRDRAAVGRDPDDDHLVLQTFRTRRVFARALPRLG